MIAQAGGGDRQANGYLQSSGGSAFTGEAQGLLDPEEGCLTLFQRERWLF